MSYHNTFDYHTLFEGYPIRVGDVLRVFDGPFGDAVILGFDDDGNAKLARPYVYAHGAGTVGPTPLVGTEIYTVTPTNLKYYIANNGIRQRDKVT